MKAFLHFLLIAVGSYFAGMVLPWWIVAPVAFVVTLALPLSPLKSFFSALLAIFVLGMILAFYMDVRNDHILSNRMSELILGVKAPPLLGAISALLGALIAGFAASSAAYLRARRVAAPAAV